MPLPAVDVRDVWEESEKSFLITIPLSALALPRDREMLKWRLM